MKQELFTNNDDNELKSITDDSHQQLNDYIEAIINDGNQMLDSWPDISSFNIDMSLFD